MTCDTVGGVWTYALNLSDALARYGIEVVLASMGRLPSMEQLRAAGSIPNLHLEARDYRLEWMEDPWTDVERAGEWLRELEADWRPALIHFNGYCHAAMDWHIPKLVVAHSCVLSWWQAVRSSLLPLPQHLGEYAARVGAGLHNADLVIAPTAAMLDTLRRLYGWRGDGRVIWNGASATELTESAKEDFILIAGRLWDEAKNLAALEAVVEQLSWPVYAAGEEVKTLASASRIRRLGFLMPAEMHRWMTRAAIYTLPARYEPFGLSILEAAAAECALVLGDIPSLRELWDGAAVFVHPDDTAGLAHRLTDLIQGPAVRSRLGSLARKRAGLFSPSAMAGAYVQVYRDLLTRC